MDVAKAGWVMRRCKLLWLRSGYYLGLDSNRRSSLFKRNISRNGNKPGSPSRSTACSATLIRRIVWWPRRPSHCRMMWWRSGLASRPRTSRLLPAIQLSMRYRSKLKTQHGLCAAKDSTRCCKLILISNFEINNSRNGSVWRINVCFDYF